MDRRCHPANWMRWMARRIGNVPRQITGSAIATSIHQATDSPENVTEGDAWSHDVGQFPQPQFPDPRVQNTCQRSADESTVINQSAFLDHKHFPERFAGKLLLPERDD